MNAATSSIVEKSPYIRAHVVHDVAEYRACREGRQEEWRQEGRDRGQRLRAGHRRGSRVQETFEAEGGTIAEAIRMPLNTTDFSPIMQRIRDSGRGHDLHVPARRASDARLREVLHRQRPERCRRQADVDR